MLPLLAPQTSSSRSPAPDSVSGNVSRASWIPVVAAAITIAITARLGFWQLDRAHQKEVLQAQYERMRSTPAIELRGADAHAERYQRVMVTGEFDERYEVLLDNQLNDGAAGYHVLTPLRMAAGGKLVMVNRGWIKRAREYPAEPLIPRESEIVTISGIVDRSDRSMLELSAETVQGKVWQNFTAQRFRERNGIDLLPLVVVQQGESAHGLVRVKAEPEFGILRHYGYAFQWFALAATALVLYVIFKFKRNRTAAS